MLWGRGGNVQDKGDHGLGKKATAFLNKVARVDLMKESMRSNSPINEHVLRAYYVLGLGTRDMAVS